MDSLAARNYDQENVGSRVETNDSDVESRLAYWLAREAEAKAEKKLFRRARHRAEAALMRNPVSSEQAWGQFGLLLGLLPPAAIFYKLFNYGFFHYNPQAYAVAAFFLLMNVVCAVVGRKMGESLSDGAFNLERGSWTSMLLMMPFVGLTWGCVTGFFGGMLFFGFGAIGGIVFAAPIGAIAFTLFAVLHRLLERGSVIDRRHLLPVAYGITLSIAVYLLKM